MTAANKKIKHPYTFCSKSVGMLLLLYAIMCTSQQILDTNHKKIYNKNLSVIQLHFYNATRDIE